ncbi:MAG: site-specific integrase [Deltaproteobacteria bacterium]|nr:site-specific integrase [Deltaproteobacteria bacterium]
MADVWRRKGRKAKPWVADYTDASGRRHRIACESKEAAQALLVEKTKEARAIGPTIPRPDMTVAQYAEGWLRGLPGAVKHATVRQYRWAVATHILPEFGRVRLRELTPGHVRVWLTDKQQAALSRSTIAQLRGILSAMLGVALEDGGIITRNVAKEFTMRRPRGDASREIEPERVLDEGEVAALIGGARDTQERALLMTLARTGCRPGELMGLQWTDPNFSKRKLLIERAIYDGIEGTTKTGKRRYVDISQQLAVALSALYVEREKEKVAGRWTKIPDWIFVRRDGSPLTSGTVRRIFDRAARRAGISGHSTYDLRHTFASLLLAKGMPLTYVSQQLGHSKPVTTLAHYSHWISSGDQCFVDVLDESSGGHGISKLAPPSGTTWESVAHLRGNLPETQLSTS